MAYGRLLRLLRVLSGEWRVESGMVMQLPGTLPSRTANYGVGTQSIVIISIRGKEKGLRKGVER